MIGAEHETEKEEKGRLEDEQRIHRTCAKE